MNKKIVIWGLVAMVILILLLLGYLSLTASTVERKVSWDYYPDYGSPDVEYLNIEWEKLNPDTTLIGTGSINLVSPLDTVRTVVFEKGFIYRIYMVAVDLAGNISEPSNVVILELLKPITIKGVKVE